jgi:hypothetical protein
VTSTLVSAGLLPTITVPSERLPSPQSGSHGSALGCGPYLEILYPQARGWSTGDPGLATSPMVGTERNVDTPSALLVATKSFELGATWFSKYQSLARFQKPVCQL